MNVPLKVVCWHLTANVFVSGIGAFERWLQEGKALTNGISAPIKEMWNKIRNLWHNKNFNNVLCSLAFFPFPYALCTCIMYWPNLPISRNTCQDIKMANRHMKRCSTSLIRETQNYNKVSSHTVQDGYQNSTDNECSIIT